MKNHWIAIGGLAIFLGAFLATPEAVAQGTTRHYYIAAEDVPWDTTPLQVGI
jgi:hypothetical protein